MSTVCKVSERGVDIDHRFDYSSLSTVQANMRENERANMTAHSYATATASSSPDMNAKEHEMTLTATAIVAIIRRESDAALDATARWNDALDIIECIGTTDASARKSAIAMLHRVSRAMEVANDRADEMAAHVRYAYAFAIRNGMDHADAIKVCKRVVRVERSLVAE